MRVSYKRAAVKDMEATRDYIAGQLKNPKQEHRCQQDKVGERIADGCVQTFLRVIVYGCLR